MFDRLGGEAEVEELGERRRALLVRRPVGLRHEGRHPAPLTLEPVHDGGGPQLLRRAADPAYCAPSVLWRCPFPAVSPAVPSAALVVYAVCHGDVGAGIAAALRAATGGDAGDCRVRWTVDLAAAACTVIVLSAGVLRPESLSSAAIACRSACTTSSTARCESTEFARASWLRMADASVDVI